MTKKVSELEPEKVAKQSFDVCSKIIENEKMIRDKTIENIPLYEEVFLNEYYKVYIGSESASWSSFLGLPEITRSRSQLRDWFLIKNNLVDKFKIPFEKLMNVKISKLHHIAVYADNREQAEDLIAKAQTLLPSEWDDTVRKAKGMPTSEDGHEHNFKKMKQCKICGVKKPIDEE